MSQKEGKFQSKSGKFGGGGKGKGRPGGRGFGKRFEGDKGGFKGGDRFEGRGGRGGKSFGGGDRPFKKKWEDRGDRGGAGGDRPFKKKFDRDGGGDRPFKKKWEGRSESGGDRPFKKKWEDRGAGGGDRPFKKKWEDRGAGGGDRPFKKKWEDRGAGGGDRPFKKKWEDRGDRGAAGGDRPFKKKWEDRGASGGDRPFKKKWEDRGDRGGDRPFKKKWEGRSEGGGDRPFKKKWEDRGDRGGDRPFKKDRAEGGGDRPFKKKFGEREERSNYRDRGDRHKPYKRNYGEERRGFRVDNVDKNDGDLTPDDFKLDNEATEAAGVTPFEASPETREKLKSSRSGFGAPSSAYLYGVHAVRAALQNPKRVLQRLLVTVSGFESIREAYEAAQNAGIAVPEPVYAESFDLERLLPRDAVHQGVLLDAQPPEEVFLADVLNAAEEHSKILVLDQVTDPHNVGAILRSAAAFGAIAVVVQKLHAPDVTGTLAKSASGAVEHIPMVREVNLTRALEQMKEAGFFCIGLAEEGKDTLSVLAPTGKVALVLGAEGEGLRRLVGETCDTLAKLPTSGPISSLNVSNAAAVALYELTRE